MALTPTRIERDRLHGCSVATAHCNKEAESETKWIQLWRKSWAALIRLVYEADPLLCPKCGTHMKIVSVNKDGAVINNWVLAHELCGHFSTKLEHSG